MQKNNSIVISSRIGFARNLANEKFPHMLSSDDGYRIFCKVANAIDGLFKQKIFQLNSLSNDDVNIMFEKHLISNKLIENANISGVVLSSDETISVMINEEDHIREQCILNGLNLEQAYSILESIDNKLDEKLGFAFDPNLGFLTSCISNVGTGLRASVMMFLPALSLSGKIDMLKDSLKKLGLTFRGEKGEGSDEDGYLFQVSNASSLGISEREIIQKLNDSVRRIAEMEKEERKKLSQDNDVAIKDMIYRAYAVLVGAFSLNVDEFNQMLSQVKLGVVLGLLRFKDDYLIDKLFLVCKPAGLAKIAGHTLVGIKENIFRADYVGQMLKQNRI